MRDMEGAFALTARYTAGPCHESKIVFTCERTVAHAYLNLVKHVSKLNPRYGKRRRDKPFHAYVVSLYSR
jgi:hypothetical protein